VARLFLLFLAVSLSAASLEDSLRALAKRIAAQLGPNETAVISLRNLSTMSRTDALGAQSIFDAFLKDVVAIRLPLRLP